MRINPGVKTWMPLVLVSAAAAALWQVGLSRPAQPERKPLFYQDSMHPWIKSDKPGKCTICEMDLTPIHEGQKAFGASEEVAVLSSNQVTVLNVQTEPAQRRAVGRRLRVAGTLEANETSKTIVSAPARGRIIALLVDYAGVEVERGQRLMTMFSPELVQIRKVEVTIAQLGQAGTGTNPVPDIGSDIYSGDIRAPQSGVVVERNVYKGQYVAEGDRMLTIVDAAVLWFRFDVYQDQLPWFQPGQSLEVKVTGIPDKVFPAVISFVEPTLNEATRTAKVRADIRNPLLEVNGVKQRLLKYGMYAEGRLRAEVANVLAVPRTAILFAGDSACAYVEKGGGAYERRILKLGRQGDELWEVLDGVEEGERVVAAGNVLIDAQAQFSQGDKKATAGLEKEARGKSMGGQDTWAGVPNHVLTSARLAEPAETTLAAPTQLQAPAKRSLSQLNYQQLESLLIQADAISGALAADDLAQFKAQVARLPAVLDPVRNDLAGPLRWEELLAPFAALSKGEAPKDLEHARTRFLPFSSGVVAFVKRLRQDAPRLPSVKIYHCPMAPEPGLWMQLQAPLRNPFFGSKMLRCGEEVRL